jgi:hypothetical protein
VWQNIGILNRIGGVMISMLVSSVAKYWLFLAVLVV